MDAYFRTEDLAVGYNGKILIHDINVEIERGKILTLIGPNGAGKSTILKSVTKQISRIHGAVYIGRQEINNWSLKDMAKKVAVVLTQRINPELMSCAEVVAMGRYPYTNLVGRLTEQDKKIVEDALKRVNAIDLADQEFSTLSDGQKQRILLARALCQEPEIIVLDEPTAYLDVRHKIELLGILREMARNKKITIIMSLHEIDLATKISDYIMCVKGDTIERFGTPEEIFESDTIEELYDMKDGSYNNFFGSVELEKVTGEPEVFVVAGGGFGIPFYRVLQKKQIPFATGILFENDIDCEVAKVLSDHVVKTKAFEPMDERLFRQAATLMEHCRYVLDAGTPVGSLNEYNKKLIVLAEGKGIPVLNEVMRIG